MDELFLTDKYQATPINQTYTVASLATVSGLDAKIIRLAKKRGLPGFKRNQLISWKELKPALEKQYGDLCEQLPNDSIGIKERLQKADLRIKVAQAKKLEGKLLAPADVRRLMVEIATKTSVAIKREFGELPPRLAGKAEPEIRLELDKAIEAIFKTLGSADEAVENLVKNIE